MSAPTEQEILAAIDNAIEGVGLDSVTAAPRDDIEEALFHLVSEAERGLWNVDDFRPSEETDNEAAVDAILDRLWPIVAEEFGRSLAAFAATHPDAPRIEREAVTA